MSLAVNSDHHASKAIRAIYPYTGNTHIIGITGPPEIGKSTLVDRISAKFRKLGKRVGFLEVDLKIPFTGDIVVRSEIADYSPLMFYELVLRT